MGAVVTYHIYRGRIKSNFQNSAFTCLKNTELELRNGVALFHQLYLSHLIMIFIYHIS